MTMKDRLLRLFLVAVVASFGLMAASPAHAQFGVTAGLNFDRLSDVTFNDVDANFDNKTGWHVGVWADFSLGVVTLRPGVRYMNAGKLFEEGLSDINAAAVDDFDITLVEVPILLRFGLGAAVVKPYVFAGPVLRFPAGVDDIIDDDLKTSSIAGELGLGLQLALGGFRLYPEIAFTFGLSSFIEDELIIGFATFQTDDTQKLNTAMLRLGVGL